MPATIRVSAVYTMSDQVSSKLARMTARVKALEENLDKSVSNMGRLEKSLNGIRDPLKKVNTDLDNMRKTIGTSKGTNGLQYRLIQLSKSLDRVGKEHKVKLTSSGVKAVDREFNRLENRVKNLTSGKHTLRIDVDKNTANILRDQAEALQSVKRSIDDVKVGFKELGRGELGLRKDLQAKTRAVEEQRISLAHARNQMHDMRKATDRYSRTLRSSRSDVQSFTEFSRDLFKSIAQGATMFRAGAQSGSGFLKILPFLAAGATAGSVALGGLVSVVHGLVTPILAVVSNAKDMVAVFGLMPGVIGAAGAAFLSFSGAMKTFFGEALAAGVKLSKIRQQLENATGEKRTQLLDQEKKLLEGMNSEQRKLAEKAAKVGETWRSVFTSNKELQKKFFTAASIGVTTLSNLIKRYKSEIQTTADAVRMVALRFFQVLNTNKDLDKGIQSVFRIARHLAGNISRSIDPLATFFGRVLQASEGPINRIGDSLERWAQSLSRITTKDLSTAFNRALRITRLWWRVLRNVGGALNNIFKAGRSDSDGFLVSLERVSRQFRYWTGGRGLPLIRREWKQGMRVARALGDILVTITRGFMGLGASEQATDSVVEFLDVVDSGFRKFFGFMDRMLATLGPSMTNFITSFGGLGPTLDGVVAVLAPLLDILAALNNAFNLIPDPLKKIVGIMIGLKLASYGVGGAFGTVIGIMAGGYRTLVNTAGVLAGMARSMRSISRGKMPSMGDAAKGVGKTSFGKGFLKTFSRFAGPLDVAGDVSTISQGKEVSITNSFANPVPVVIIGSAGGAADLLTGGGGDKKSPKTKGGRTGRLGRFGRVGAGAAGLLGLLGLKRTKKVPESGFARQLTISENMQKVGRTGLNDTRGFSPAAARFASRGLKAVPVLGTAAAVGTELAYGEGSMAKRAGRAGSGLAGAAAGGLVGAQAGALAGTVVPGVGNVIGGAVGGLAGSVAGYFGGAKIFDAAANRFDDGTQTFADRAKAMGFEEDEYKAINGHLRKVAENTGMTTQSLKELDRSIKEDAKGIRSNFDWNKIAPSVSRDKDVGNADFQARMDAAGGPSGVGLFKTSAMLQLAQMIETQGQPAATAEWVRKFPELADNTKLIEEAVNISGDMTASEISNMRMEFITALEGYFGTQELANKAILEMRDKEIQREKDQATAAAATASRPGNQTFQPGFVNAAATSTGTQPPSGYGFNPHYQSKDFRYSGIADKQFIPLSQGGTAQPAASSGAGGASRSSTPAAGPAPAARGAAQPSAASAGLAGQAVVGKSQAGLKVAFDPKSLQTFEASVTRIRSSFDKIKIQPRQISAPMALALKNTEGVIVAYQAKLVTAMDALGQAITSSVTNWAGRVSSALSTLSPGITWEAVQSQISGGSSSGSSASASSGSSSSSSSNAQRRAGGGYIVPGDPRRPDSVHALLKPGEVVLNEGQQRKLGKALVTKSLAGPGTAANGAFGFNMAGASSRMTRYASGGTVSELAPYMDKAAQLGGTITSTTGGGHAAGSYHYSGQAFDVDGGTAVNKAIFAAFEGDAKLGKLVELFFDPSGAYKNGQKIPPIGGHADHVHAAVALGAIAGALSGTTAIQLPDSPNLGNTKFGVAAQNATDIMRGVMQQAVNATSTNFSDLYEGGSGAAGSNKEMGRQMAASMYGWAGSEWASLHELWMRESGWDNTIRNPSSGAFGIPQALPESKLPPAGQASGGASASAQIGWGLNYIKNRYGTPSAALAFHNAHNWYGKGGSGIADKPQLIGVGDKREHVQITPATTQANPAGITGARAGAANSSITNNFYIGTLSGDREHLAKLAAMVGDSIADALDNASRSQVGSAREVMSGNG